jgi:uncharacterized membrane protein YedE/YeeE
MKQLVAAGVGLVLALALGYGRLTQPSVILGWVDLHHWDPSLLWFMTGASLAYGLGYKLALRRGHALLGCELAIPTNQVIDARLIAGSSIFGAGWTLAGACPGPALTSLGAGASWALPFVVAMLVGLRLGGLFAPQAPKPRATPHPLALTHWR